MEYDDILDYGQDQVHLVPASKTKRLINYLIDIVLGSFLFFGITEFWTIFMDLPDTTFEQSNSLLTRLVTMVFFALYYILLESALHGKTPGKYITRTRALTLDAEVPDLPTIAKRSIYRMVPFEALSFLGQRDAGWHDRWSGTIVIDEDLSTW